MDSSSNREMRDQVLALLLSGQKSSRPRRRVSTSPPSAFEPWTPGAHLGETAAAAAAGSPVTPERPALRLPTDTDVRLAEITAGLVAASDKERRQTETIRRLALQLERVRARKGSGGSAGESASTSAELEQLRREKREWQRRERTVKKETQAAEAMLKDIRRTAERVLAERDGHLRVIASLQQQLHEAQQARSRRNSSVRDESHPQPGVQPRQLVFSQPPPTPEPKPALAPRQTTFSQTSQSAQPEVCKTRDATPQDTVVSMRTREPGTTQSEGVTRTKQGLLSRTGSLPELVRGDADADGAAARAEETVRSRAGSAAASETRDEGETQLHRDLIELLDENKQLKQALAEREPAQLHELDDELRLLEIVVETMEFSMDTDDAKQMQQTMSSIGFQATAAAPTDATKQVSAKALAKRVAAVHATLATKYGKYLADFNASDDTLSMPPGATLPTLASMADTVASMREPEQRKPHADTPVQ